MPIVLTHFARDAYAPTVTRGGQVLFKTQDYRVFVAVAPAAGGPTRAVTTFMSENPTWSPTGDRVSVTFGNWRRVVDDFRYPDIAQDIGIVGVDLRAPQAKGAPDTVFRASPSEDQGMQWSPNGRWAAFHSHADHTDDIYLQPADRSAPPRKISAGPLRETGYARWSPDGRSIMFTAYEREGAAMRPGVYLVGVDQATGAVTQPQRRIPIEFAGNPVNVEWLPDGRRLVFEGATQYGNKALYIVPLAGGRPTAFHEFQSDQLDSGISVSADGRGVAFIAPDHDGHLQVFRLSLAGGNPRQLTFDPTDKTQPAYDPTGHWIAFTIFNYMAQFWLLDPS
jgi:Tol biopolymer transport system component